VTVLCSWDTRNHTWKLTEALRSSTITLDWQRKNKTVFKSVNYAGYIGVLTAIKPVRFMPSVTIHITTGIVFCTSVRLNVRMRGVCE